MTGGGNDCDEIVVICEVRTADEINEVALCDDDCCGAVVMIDDCKTVEACDWTWKVGSCEAVAVLDAVAGVETGDGTRDVDGCEAVVMAGDGKRVEAGDGA